MQFLTFCYGVQLFSVYTICVEKSVPVGGAFLPNACSLAPPKKAQLGAPLSPLQTAWTSFDPYLYSGWSSSAGSALVEIRSFILNRGIVTDTMSATPLEPGW